VEQIEREGRDRKAMTRLACDRCKWLERKKGGVPEWALEWWTSHVQADAERVSRSKQAQREAAVRKRALAKLTKEERDELGL